MSRSVMKYYIILLYNYVIDALLIPEGKQCKQSELSPSIRNQSVTLSSSLHRGRPHTVSWQESEPALLLGSRSCRVTVHH